MRTRVKLMGVVVILVGFVTACGGSPEPVQSADTVDRDQARVVLPAELLGLRVETESVGVDRLEQTYFDSLGLYSFRTSEDLLRATLQVGRFNDQARPEDARFRRGIIGNLGSSVPEELRVGETIVHLSTGNEQSIYAWFDEQALYVLSIRDDYLFPRTMLRRLTEMRILQ